MMVITATKDQAVVIYENPNSRFYVATELSHHEAIALHSSEDAQPINPPIWSVE